MILLDMKNSKTVSSPLNLSASKDKPLLSFSDLLRGASEKKEGKTIQNGSLVLALGSEEKSIKSTKSLLKTDNLASLALSSDEEQELLELNPKLANPYSHKGYSLGKLGRLDEAMKLSNKALEIEPDYAKALYRRTYLHLLNNDKANALKDLTKAVSLYSELKKQAGKDKDFEPLWNDEDFKKIVN